jgi:fumarate reductase subunit D
MAELLFCPFCREPFEDARECPDHELVLVPWRELPESHEAADHTPVALLSPRFGRGWVMVGGLLVLLGFVLPLAAIEAESRLAGSAWQLARAHTFRLWLVPTAVLALGLVLHRRRSPAAMRGARLAVLLLSVVPALAVLITLKGVWAAAELLELKTRMATAVQLGAGSWLIGLGCACLIVGGTRLGVSKPVRVRSPS